MYHGYTASLAQGSHLKGRLSKAWDQPRMASSMIQTYRLRRIQTPRLLPVGHVIGEHRHQPDIGQAKHESACKRRVSKPQSLRPEARIPRDQIAVEKDREIDRVPVPVLDEFAFGGKRVCRVSV